METRMNTVEREWPEDILQTVVAVARDVGLPAEDLLNHMARERALAALYCGEAWTLLTQAGDGR